MKINFYNSSRSKVREDKFICRYFCKSNKFSSRTMWYYDTIFEKTHYNKTLQSKDKFFQTLNLP